MCGIIGYAGTRDVVPVLIGGLKKLVLRTTKPPRGLAGAPHVVAQKIDLDALTVPTTIFEGDVLRSTVHLEGTEPLPDGGGLVTLRVEVTAQRADGALDAVLDWRLVGAMA